MKVIVVGRDVCYKLIINMLFIATCYLMTPHQMDLLIYDIQDLPCNIYNHNITTALETTQL